MTLHQVYTSDRERIVRSVYAEDLEFIKKFHQSPGAGLDICVNDTLSNISETSKFFKVETDRGALVGFFAVAVPVDEVNVLEGFHIRVQYRKKEVLSLWWDLIRSMFVNEFYTSVSANNYQAIKHLLKNNFNEITTGHFYGKDFVIFLHNNN